MQGTKYPRMVGNISRIGHEHLARQAKDRSSVSLDNPASLLDLGRIAACAGENHRRLLCFMVPSYTPYTTQAAGSTP